MACMNKTIEYLSLPWNFLFKYTIPDCSDPAKEKWYLVSFGMSVVWLAVLSYLLSDMCTRLGCIFNISSVIMGVTFLAAGTSVPDALGSIIAAKDGMGDMAVSNAIGSNVFDICLGLGIPYLIQTGMVDPGGLVSVQSNAGSLAEGIIILFSTLAALLVIMAASRWQLTKLVGSILLAAYFAFVLFELLKGAVHKGV